VRVNRGRAVSLRQHTYRTSYMSCTCVGAWAKHQMSKSKRRPGVGYRAGSLKPAASGAVGAGQPGASPSRRDHEAPPRVYRACMYCVVCTGRGLNRRAGEHQATDKHSYRGGHPAIYHPSVTTPQPTRPPRVYLLGPVPLRSAQVPSTRTTPFRDIYTPWSVKSKLRARACV
jgi:hypothetical protein